MPVEHAVPITSNEVTGSKSPVGKNLKLLGVTAVALALPSMACVLTGGVDPFAEPPLDPMAQTAQANGLRNQQEIINMTATAQAPRVPAATRTPQTPLTFANDTVMCAQVVDDPANLEDGTVSEAIMRANNGVQPPNYFNGMEMHVSLDTQGQRKIAVFEEIMTGEDTSMNNPQVGDKVCIAVNQSALERMPQPTPKP
ncbi:MAG: hypothetical protein NTV98_03430 [Candidatus Roizmanbacteria bacterium]|nr:hypothetical protein [Candidatus Roizmanbacteria bacterium]